MNKKLWIGFIAVYVGWNLLDLVIHAGLLSGAYQSDEMMRVWRPDMMSKLWIFYIVSAFTSFFFTLIFSKWYKGKGIVEGIQYGVYMGLLMATPMAYSSYAMYPIPYSLALQWFIYGMVQYVVLGIVVSMIFGKKPADAPVAA